MRHPIQFTVDYVIIAFLVAVSKYQARTIQGKSGFLGAPSLGIQIIVVGSAWCQECEAEDHSAPATKSQREATTSLSAVLLLPGVKERQPLAPAQSFCCQSGTSEHEAVQATLRVDLLLLTLVT